MERISANQFETTFFELIGDPGKFSISIKEEEAEPGLYIYHLALTSEEEEQLNPITIQCKLPGIDILGVWQPNALYDKRLRADWEAPSIGSRVSVGAPVISLFGHRDQNKLTLACNDAVNLVWLAAPVREEDNLIYASLTFFSDAPAPTQHYEAKIRVDLRELPFYQTLQAVSDWWNSFPELKAAEAPSEAFDAVYSTWYAYHQNLDKTSLLNECIESREMGYKTIIIDDGWQTYDTNRGYDYTGDWKPQRFPQFREMVDEMHALGMKVLIWYSVPFCGEKSKAYQKFAGKFLTENHRWAPVFDPRYPEVRAYLVETYAQALTDWNLDGFKLDFIDDFKVYPETPRGKENGRDTASVYVATQQLVREIYLRLREIKPDVLIEFRQQFIGPVMQQNANMFRAFDCPNDAISNRIRTTDTRLLNANAAVHSDMITWHYEESVEVAARQFLNIMFSVPQISVRLQEISSEHKAMIAFLTDIWLSRREVLMHGSFRPENPMANYPVIRAHKDEHLVMGIYENQIIRLEPGFQKIDILNGSASNELVLSAKQTIGEYALSIFDCMGNLTESRSIQIGAGLLQLDIPQSGIAVLSSENK